MEKASAATARLLHPDWEYRFFGDDDIRNFIRAEYPELERAYEAFPRKIQRIDFFRYLVVQHLGGFYLDMDVVLYAPLTPLLECECVFPFEELTINRFLRNECAQEWEIGNYAFGAPAEAPFLSMVIENCLRAQADRAWSDQLMRAVPRPFRPDYLVLNTTGPGLISRTLAESGSIGKAVTVLFPDDITDSDQWHQFGSYGVHLMAGSWREKCGYLKRRFLHAWETLQRRQSLKQVGSRTRRWTAAASVEVVTP